MKDYKVPSYTRWRDDYKLLVTFALVKDLIFSTSYVQHEQVLKSPNLLPKDYRQMSKKEELLEVVDKIVEALDQEVVPFSVLASITCGGKPDQNCSQCDKKIVVQGILLPYFSWVNFIFHRNLH